MKTTTSETRTATLIASVGKTAPERVALTRAATHVRRRVAESVSGYVLVRRFKTIDKKAALLMIEAGEIEKYDSPLGSAYRGRS